MFLGDKLKEHSIAAVQAAIADAVKNLTGADVKCSIGEVDFNLRVSFGVGMKITLTEGSSILDELPK